MTPEKHLQASIEALGRERGAQFANAVHMAIRSSVISAMMLKASTDEQRALTHEALLIYIAEAMTLICEGFGLQGYHVRAEVERILESIPTPTRH